MTDLPSLRNELSGTAAAVIQAGTVAGGVHFHGSLPAVPVPRQLPPQSAHFVNRAAALAAATGALDLAGPGVTVLVQVCGAGGAGKTAFAGRVLHQLAGRYGGGQLYAALGACSPAGPAEAADVIARWLRGLGVHPSVLPGDPQEALALFRSLTACGPVAVLADDAASTEQVRALLPAAGSLVIVTSRRELPGLAADGARLITLGPLETSDAAELAARVAGRDSPAVAYTDLARRCGGLPLAVRTVAARLAAGPHLSIARVTADLTAARDSTHPESANRAERTVTAAMQASYDDLAPQAARACRLLGVWDGPDVTAGSAAALLDTGPDQATELIAALAGAGLLAEIFPGRWAVHGPAAARARTSNGERSAALGRIIEYYLRGSASADRLILKGRLRLAPAFARPGLALAFGTPAEALAWLDAEQDNLLAAQQAAAGLCWYTLAWQFCDTLWGWCSHRHQYQSWATVCRTAITAAHAVGDARAEVFATIRLALCLMGQGKAADAAMLSEHAITIAATYGDLAGEASAREHAALAALNARDYDAVIRHCERGLDCWYHALITARG